MIKFFRKIRKSLLMENKTNRYFKYAIGEIILVVIGILIALQINNWNENRKDRLKEIEVLSQLKTDLITILEELNNDIRDETAWIARTDSIINYNSETTQNFTNLFIPKKNLPYIDDVKLYPSKSTYENLKTIGLDLIKDTQFRLKLIDLYERLLPRVEVWENFVYEYQDRLLILAEQQFIKTPISPIDGNNFALVPKSYNTYIESNEFQNALLKYNERRRFMIERYIDVKKQVKELLDML